MLSAKQKTHIHMAPKNQTLHWGNVGKTNNCDILILYSYFDTAINMSRLLDCHLIMRRTLSVPHTLPTT